MSNTDPICDKRAKESIGTREPGWCDEHDEFAWRYSDGSIACFWAQIVETGTNDCRLSRRTLVADEIKRDIEIMTDEIEVLRGRVRVLEASLSALVVARSFGPMSSEVNGAFAGARRVLGRAGDTGGAPNAH